jgi:cytochrome c oxidase cbb3-type subunit 3
VPASVSFGSGDRLERGRRVYNEHCYFCHGYSGNGRTLATRYLDPPPRAFSSLRIGAINRRTLIDTVIHGKAGTAMQPFASVLPGKDIAAAVDYIIYAFVEHKLVNTYYHTAENGWPDHERYRDAFPFALGDVALDTPEEQLTPEQRRGKQLFISTCVVCHDRGRLNDDRTVWEPRAVSFPRGGYSPGEKVTDAESGATPYARHDRKPVLENATASQRRGEALYQDNCAFCHAADGTGANWIGSFLNPKPRDLTDPAFAAATDSERLRESIAKGVMGSAMPAWRAVLSDADIADVAAYVEKVFLRRAPDDRRAGR